jgi:hypothetical protein
MAVPTRGQAMCAVQAVAGAAAALALNGQRGRHCERARPEHSFKFHGSQENVPERQQEGSELRPDIKLRRSAQPRQDF